MVLHWHPALMQSWSSMHPLLALCAGQPACRSPGAKVLRCRGTDDRMAAETLISIGALINAAGDASKGPSAAPAALQSRSAGFAGKGQARKAPRKAAPRQPRQLKR